MLPTWRGLLGGLCPRAQAQKNISDHTCNQPCAWQCQSAHEFAFSYAAGQLQQRCGRGDGFLNHWKVGQGKKNLLVMTARLTDRQGSSGPEVRGGTCLSCGWQGDKASGYGLPGLSGPTACGRQNVGSLCILLVSWKLLFSQPTSKGCVCLSSNS